MASSATAATRIAEPKSLGRAEHVPARAGRRSALPNPGVGGPSMTVEVRDAGVELVPDASRVIARLYLPGEGYTRTGSRAGDIMDRIEALPPDRVRAVAQGILAEFGPRHERFAELLGRHAATVAFRAGEAPTMDRDREVVLGAAFTAEHSVEAAALCDPSAVTTRIRAASRPARRFSRSPFARSARGTSRRLRSRRPSSIRSPAGASTSVLCRWWRRPSRTATGPARTSARRSSPRQAQRGVRRNRAYSRPPSAAPRSRLRSASCRSNWLNATTTAKTWM